MPSFTDPASRVFDLIEAAEPEFQRRFLAAVVQLRDQQSLTEIARQLAAGDDSAALAAAEAGAKRVASISRAAFVRAGEATAQFIGTKINSVFDFDSANERAVAYLQARSRTLIREFTADQVLATRTALEDGIRRGLNSRAQARLFRDSLGLTSRQMQHVQSYRRALESRSTNALGRALRDRRFDRTVQTAIEGRKVLTPAQIDRMVGRYQDRYLIYRSQVIARTESLSSVNAASQETYAQAIDEGKVSGVKQTWTPARDGRVRDSHDAMRGQERDMGVPFESGAGNLLRYPGDPDAPEADVIQCRCALATRAQVAA